MTAKPTRQPAVEPVEPPAGPERGTGEAGPETSAQAVMWGQGENCPHRPEWHCETHSECRGCECGCDTVNPEPEAADGSPWEVELVPGVWVSSARQNGKTAKAIAAAVEAARPVHLREASASIHTIADHMPGRHPEFVRGVRYAATLLGHTADDMGDGDG